MGGYAGRRVGHARVEAPHRNHLVLVVLILVLVTLRKGHQVFLLHTLLHAPRHRTLTATAALTTQVEARVEIQRARCATPTTEPRAAPTMAPTVGRLRVVGRRAAGRAALGLWLMAKLWRPKRVD